MDRSKPARVDLPADVIQICAGGMHSVCLTVGGEVSCQNRAVVYFCWLYQLSSELVNFQNTVVKLTGHICIYFSEYFRINSAVDTPRPISFFTAIFLVILFFAVLGSGTFIDLES